MSNPLLSHDDVDEPCLELLTDVIIEDSEIIIVNKRIRDRHLLADRYNVSVDGWEKVSSDCLFDKDGAPYKIHWYEHPNLGFVECKIKPTDDYIIVDCLD